MPIEVSECPQVKREAFESNPLSTVDRVPSLASEYYEMNRSPRSSPSLLSWRLSTALPWLHSVSFEAS